MFKRLSDLFGKLITALSKRPATSFFVLLILLFGVIALGRFLRTPEIITDNSLPTAKETTLFDISTDTAFVIVPAKVKKESIVNIVALTPGVVVNIFTLPGRSVLAGQTLLTLSNDYQSGSSELQKRLAGESARLTEELAKIDKDITALEEKKTKRDSQLSNIEEDIALAKLEKERATRKSSLQQSALSTQLTNVSDAVLKPKIFASGIIQTIRVKRGDLVSPGQILATVSTPRGATTLEALIDPATAYLFDTTKEAKIKIGNDTVTLLPTYFSRSENENGLFSILFTLSEDMKNRIVNGSFLHLSLPLKKTSEVLALVPIDAVFQDESTASVLVEQDGKAVTKTVMLGNLSGSFVEILSGLGNTDRIILNRTIISGDSVSVVSVQ